MDNAPRTHDEQIDRAVDSDHGVERVLRQKVVVRKRFIDPAEAVMNSNPNLSPPIVPIPN